MAAPPILVFDAAGNFVRAWGGDGQRLRMAGARARHPHRPQGLRVGGRQQLRRAQPARAQAGQRRPAAEVHAGRQVRDADRPQQPEQGQRRHAEPAPAGRRVGAAEDQRVVRRRRLRQPPRGRVRCRHRQVQAHVGRVRQQAGGRGRVPAAQPEGGARTGPAPINSASCTPSAWRTTAWCTWPTAKTGASRCSPATASS